MRRVVESASAASRITAQSGINRRIAAAGKKVLFYDELYDRIARNGIPKLHPIDNRQVFPFIIRPAEFLQGLAQAPLGCGSSHGQSIGSDIDFISVC